MLRRADRRGRSHPRGLRLARFLKVRLQFGRFLTAGAALPLPAWDSALERR